jgi:hypothetical protein
MNTTVNESNRWHSKNPSSMDTTANTQSVFFRQRASS